MPRGAFSPGKGRILLGLASSSNACRHRLDRPIAKSCRGLAGATGPRARVRCGVGHDGAILPPVSRPAGEAMSLGCCHAYKRYAR